MGTNWKRGLTRLYVLIWAGWLVFIGMRASVIFNWANVLPGIAAIFLAGILAPALLLWGLRWTIDGFRSPVTG